MKELSIEEKAKRYDEAIKRAKKWHNAPNIDKMPTYGNRIIEEIFPELKESEDERIRKVIINHLTQERGSLSNDEAAEAVAWLEKQSEQKSNPCDGCINKKGCINCENGELREVEQKPADKVESKFKVGEWVVQENIGVYKVIEVCESWYEVVDNKNKHYSIGFDKEYMCHLWTIDDAKDGDVLCYETNEVKWIFIYREIVLAASEVPHDLLRYYFLLEGNYFNWNGVIAMVTDDYEKYLKPATKEQRDTLMKAMYEAGYIFDFEKKKLKKLGSIDEYEGLTDFERTLADICIGWMGKEIGWKEYIKDNADILLKIAIKKFNSVQDTPFEQKPTDNEMKELLQTEYEKGRADAIAEMQSPAWSDNDEEMLCKALYFLDAGYNNFKYTDGIPECKDWLKSLKDRVQPKQEWSEEDESILQGIWDEILANKHNAKECEWKTYDKFLDWLKYLKNRVQPKHILHKHTIFDQII